MQDKSCVIFLQSSKRLALFTSLKSKSEHGSLLWFLDMVTPSSSERLPQLHTKSSSTKKVKCPPAKGHVPSGFAST